MVQFYGEWRLESVQSGRTSLTAVPSERVKHLSDERGCTGAQPGVQGTPNSLPLSKMKVVLEELKDGSLGGHLAINKTLNKVRQQLY
jgi:hypothetical protein